MTNISTKKFKNLFNIFYYLSINLSYSPHSSGNYLLSIKMAFLYKTSGSYILPIDKGGFNDNNSSGWVFLNAISGTTLNPKKTFLFLSYPTF